MRYNISPQSSLTNLFYECCPAGWPSCWRRVISLAFDSDIIIWLVPTGRNILFKKSWCEVLFSMLQLYLSPKKLHFTASACFRDIGKHLC